jgi:hypothetical protein
LGKIAPQWTNAEANYDRLGTERIRDEAFLIAGISLAVLFLVFA